MSCFYDIYFKHTFCLQLSAKLFQELIDQQFHLLLSSLFFKLLYSKKYTMLYCIIVTLFSSFHNDAYL